MGEERCVMCGEIIPEGRQVCPTCEKNANRVKKKTDETSEDVLEELRVD